MALHFGRRKGTKQSFLERKTLRFTRQASADNRNDPNPYTTTEASID